ncbi:hypothetical protein [Streptomyces mirabilis]|uniref:hypothetical protein n=1 Tax=Streptomyces mirabilis TaxID=68239 RepID=UPI003426D09E
MTQEEYDRTQKVLDTLNELERTQVEKRKAKEPFSRGEALAVLQRLHLALEEMNWAGDFERKEGSE